MLPNEIETTITYDKEEQTVRIFSAWPKDQRKIERAGVKPYAGTPETGLFYRVPLRLFRWKVRPVGQEKLPSRIAAGKRILEQRRAVQKSDVTVSDGS